MTIKELREKRKKAWDTARDFLDSKRNANGVLSEEDAKTYDAMEQTIVDLGKEIQRLERQASSLASSIRMRQPPENSLVGRLKSERSKPRPSRVFSTSSSKWVMSIA